MELLWVLEEKFREKEKECLKKVKYEELTIKQLLDLGFNNCYLRIGKQFLNIGFKTRDNIYVSDDLEFTEEQLKTKIKYRDYDYDMHEYCDLFVDLLNEEDEKYFMGCEND